MTATQPTLDSFADVPLHGGTETAAPTTDEAVAAIAAAATANGYTADQWDWATPEGIDVKPVYIAADRAADVRREPAEEAADREEG